MQLLQTVFANPVSLTATSGFEGDPGSAFGSGVALTEQWLIVGVPGARKAFLYKNNGGTWGIAPAFTLAPNTVESGFGTSVALTDQWAIVGASSASKAFLFKNNGGTWGTTPAFTLDQNSQNIPAFGLLFAG